MAWAGLSPRIRAKIYHGGANETFRTDLNLYPDNDLGFVLLVNIGHQLDHYISSPQLTGAVEAALFGVAPAPLSQGWSVRWVGWGVGLLVLGLLVLHTYNFVHLTGWHARTRSMSLVKVTFDIAISFVIPTAILIFVFSQIKAFYGYRFNLWPTMVMLPRATPDVFILMLVGSLPDYIQGFMKLSLLIVGKTRTA